MAILFYSDCHKQQIKLVSRLEKNLFVSADPHLIEQVLVNIIKNAIEAIDDSQNGKRQDTIVLSLEQKTSEIQLEIIDSGCGISEEIKHQLFTPFFTTKESGQGVGLMLIDEILTSHKFSYKLANNSSGKGAYFRICFQA